MLTNKITGFSADFLDAVKNILGEAKKCPAACECEKCEAEDEDEKEETKEGYMPTSDEPTDANKKTADKVRALLAKEKKPVKEESGMPFEKPYRKAGERKDEYGNKVKNVAKHLAKKAMKANEEADYLEKDLKKRKDNNDKAIKDMKKMGSPMRNPHFGEEVEQVDEISSDMAHRYLKGKRERDYDISADGKSSKLKKPQSFGKMNKDMKSTARALRTIEKAKKTNEEVEELDEVSKATLGRYINKAKNSIDLTAWRQGHKEADVGANPKHVASLGKKLDKRHRGIETAVKKLTKEDAEHVEEAVHSFGSEKSKFDSGHRAKLMNPDGKLSYLSQKSYKTAEHAKEAAKFYHSVAHLPMRAIDNRMSQYNKDYDAKHKMAEEVEQIDELSKATLGSYVKKATNQAFSRGYSGGAMMVRGDMNRDSEEEKAGEKNVHKAIKRVSGVTKATNKLTQEEQDFIDSLNDADMEQIDELSNRTLGSYVKKAKKQLSSSDYHVGRAVGAREAGQKSNFSPELERKLAARGKKRYDGIDKAVDKMMTKEEIEQIDEARGRPRKAGAKDFTIHPKTKEKLMHNNPADMKRIERLQKNGILEKPKVEASQHIMNQLQKAKTSMTGGTTINFTHGDSKHVSGTHAARLLDKYAGMKPNEKEDFQKKIGHSHEQLMKHV